MRSLCPQILALFLLTILLSVSPLLAADQLSNEDEQELNQLIKLLDKHTEIATQTRMNADYIPGMVTVLQGKDLETRGIRSLAEALTLVPGIDVSINNSGTPSLVSRGFGNSYAPQTSMILINGSPMNSAFSGSGSGVAFVPIEQVERIEVIRGPGGAINGEFAYSGVINIITRTDSNRTYAMAGRFATYSGGALASWHDEAEDTLLALNIAGSESNGSDPYVGPDGFGNYGYANKAQESLTGFATLKYHDFTLQAHLIKGGQGDFFGTMPVGTMPTNQHDISAEQHYKTVEARQQLTLNSTLDLFVKAGWQEYENINESSYITPQGYSNALLNGGSPYPEGILIGLKAREQKYYASLDTTWKGWQNHTLLTGIDVTYNKLMDLWMAMNVASSYPYQPTGWQVYSGQDNFIVPEDADRTLFSGSIQDEYRITKTIHLTTGLRFDHYDDVGNSITPRIAGVWNPLPHHIFKAQYARAFRPPTFTELYGNQNYLKGNTEINPEKVDTYEIGYIFRSELRTAKVTIFYSDHHDLITARSTGSNYAYTNSGGGTQQGVELELAEQLSRTLKFDGNISYVKTKDDDTNTDVSGARNWLANAGLIYKPFTWTALSGQYRYVGEQQRATTDSRADVKSYDVMDFTVSLFPLPGLTLRMGINNAFAEDVRCASSSSSTYNTQQGYIDDLPTQERFWWLQCAYEL